MGDPGLATTQLLIRSPRRHGRGQVLSNLRQQLTRTDGLGHVGIATRRTRLVLSLIQFISCDGNDRYSVQCRVGFEATGRDEARSAVMKLLQLAPGYRVSNVREVYPLRRPQDLAKFEEGLRKAGLPE